MPKIEKKKTPKQLKKRLWELCRQLADILYPPRCFTCGAPISGSNKQLGHFIASSVCGAYLRYDIRNLRWQCMRCNCFAGGNGAIYYRRLVETEGQKYVDQLFRDKQITVKADVIFYMRKIAWYELEIASKTLPTAEASG
jgi:hypothetical protein